MIIGNGIDIVNIERFKNTFENFDKKFIDKILNDKEKANFPKDKQKKIEFIAKHWAVKEAVSKSIGCGLLNGSKIHFKDIILNKDKFNKPFVEFEEKTLNVICDFLKINKNKKDKIKIHISTSGDGNYIIANSILELLEK